MIESLNSPHVGRVKALISSRGSKERNESGLFIAEGIQCVREALSSSTGPKLQTLYVTNSALEKFSEVVNQAQCEVLSITDDVARTMSDTVTPQGLIAVCTKNGEYQQFLVNEKKLLEFESKWFDRVEKYHTMSVNG
jgi:TrmH family RNA methyltransferase